MPDLTDTALLTSETAANDRQEVLHRRWVGRTPRAEQRSWPPCPS